MKKTFLTLGIALASLVATHALAQKDVPGEGRAQPAAAATPAEKAAAKQARKAEGTITAKTASTADTPAPMGKAKATSPAEKEKAKAKRKADGAATARGPKEPN